MMHGFADTVNMAASTPFGVLESFYVVWSAFGPDRQIFVATWLNVSAVAVRSGPNHRIGRLR
jgi:hypothetical protein